MDTETPTWKSKDPHTADLDERMKSVSGVMSSIKKY
jgi:hypothetical protein